ADFGVEIGRNLIHASDASETAQYEIPLYFAGDELVSWSRASDQWIME
ncbi:MAG TPA: nucleoside-diphosphate kinase, partial [Anaerolineae bacterium]|nr:nucleoside-diphosphate kinase [Anaerolineae bacterium]